MGINAVRKERGQTLLIFVLAISVLLGFTAMAIDVGLFFEDRRHFQNSADAMALAGVAELPLNPAAATSKAQEWAANNDVDPSEIKTIEVRMTGVPNDTLFVELEGDFGWIFGRVLGQTTSKVGARAAARIGTLVGGHNMMPWALLRGDTNCLDAVTGKAIFGATCQVKVGAQNGIGGWRGALDYDGNGGGANEYRDNIVDGAVDWLYCIQGDPSPACTGSHTVADSLTGNKVGPTGQGIEARWATGAKCDNNGNGKDDFNEVFTPTGQVSPAYTVSCPNSPWLIIIPIITYESVPIQKVTIRGWTLAYLSSYACVGGNNCGGGKGHWEVSIEIADAAYSQTAGFLGNFDPTSGVLIRRLIE
jgi:putative Flp pilus-assembly TadE/G-like protein